MILAAEHGRVGERYLISEKMISNAEVARIAAEAAGIPAAGEVDPAAGGLCVGHRGSVKAQLRGTDERLSLGSLRLMRAEAEVDHCKATRELGLEAKAGGGVDPRGRPVLGGPARGQAKEQDRLAEPEQRHGVGIQDRVRFRRIGGVDDVVDGPDEGLAVLVGEVGAQ